MKRLALTLVICGGLASVSLAQAPPAAPSAQAGVVSTTTSASCDGCVEGKGKSSFFHHHSWSLFGHKEGKHSSLFSGAHKAPAPPPGQPAFPTHPYARGPRDFFMYE